MTIPDGVYSEIGRLRTVLVCWPSLAQKRLAPANSRDLFLDESPWVAQARNDHNAFNSARSGRDIEVLVLHELQLLAESMADLTAGAWLLDRMLGLDYVDPATAALLRPWLEELSPAKLVERLMGRVARSRLPWEAMGGLARRAGASDFPMPPLPAQVPPRHRLGRAGKLSGRTRSRPAQCGEDWPHRWRVGQALEGAFNSTRCDAAANAHRHRDLAHRAHQQRALNVLELDRRTAVPTPLFRQTRQASSARPDIVLVFTTDGIPSQRLARQLSLTKEPT